MDPNNTVVRLCVQGMECEGWGLFEDASRLFLSAWKQSTSDFERCISAHYVARHQKDPLDTLRWNQVSLDRANAVGDDRVREFYPSLYFNLGKAHEDMGSQGEAKRFYEMSARVLNTLPEGRYGSMVREAVQNALLRIADHRLTQSQVADAAT
ncbi:MAG TPA: hypothetical protein VMS18_22115 [Candidatus Binatia bacterium]|nr:hypothetical protein [Candidatus Binatia bacterium]